MTITRRRLLRRSAAALAVASGVTSAQTTSRAASKRPNILFALADDWSWPSVNGGDPVLKTPVFERLQRTGVLFTNAFVSAPSCSPSRAATLTGQCHWRLEEGANLGGTLATKFPVYPDLLEQQGYHVGFTRKGWAPGDEKPGGRNRNPAGPRFDDFSAFLAARPKDAPFCFWFGSVDPHRPYTRNSGEAAGIRWQDVRVPPYLPDHETVRRDIADYYLEVQRFDTELGELLATIEKNGELDNTIVVMTGDNGWPFPRAKATIYDSGTQVPLAISWPARCAGGRRLDDFVSMTDLAPTFLEAVGIAVPKQMTGRSLMPLLTSRKKAGTVDSRRSHVLTGMERHVPSRGEIRGGYPMRAIRTKDFLYIRNFLPDRWPSGDANGLENLQSQPFTFDQLESQTFVALADIDSGPTKAHMVTHRAEPAVGKVYAMAAGKRPDRELYDIRKDPFQLENLAQDTAHGATVKRLDGQLMAALKATGDPRASGGGDEFDKYIWYQGRQQQQQQQPGKKKKKR